MCRLCLRALRWAIIGRQTESSQTATASGTTAGAMARSSFLEIDGANG
jgi:hypothetical protein